MRERAKKVTALRKTILGYMLVVFATLFLALVGVVHHAPSAHAAPCVSPGDDYGMVTSTTSVGTSSTYRLWTRIAAPNSSDNSYRLEVDGTTCYDIGGAAVPTYANGASTRFQAGSANWISTTTTGDQVDVSLSSGSHTFKLIGMAEGVVIDRLLLTTDTACRPTDTGHNCASAYFVADINQDTRVNFRDFSMLADKYNQTGGSLGRIDINGDGAVDALDYSILASRYDHTAANQYVSLEAEAGSPSGALAPFADTSASNSGGVIFGTAPSPAGCVGDDNEPGGPDPWGGCWPGAYNTGYPHGLPGDTRTPVTLTNYTGPAEITSCGTVIENKIVNTWLLLRAGNGTHSKDTPCLTIRNSKIIGTINTLDVTHGPILIEDSEIDTTDEAIASGIPFVENLGRYNIFAYRVNSHGGDPTIKCAAYCETKDSMAHSPTLGGHDRHYNSIGGNGMEAGSWNIEHNYASCGDWSGTSTGSPPSGDSGCSAAIGFYGDFSPVRNITIHRNLLRAAYVVGGPEEFRQASYCLNPGYYNGKPYPNPTNMTITDNIFHRSVSGTCAIFGPTNSLNAIGQGSTNIWSGNRYTDGAVINRVEE